MTRVPCTTKLGLLDRNVRENARVDAEREKREPPSRPGDGLRNCRRTMAGASGGSETSGWSAEDAGSNSHGAGDSGTASSTVRSSASASSQVSPGPSRSPPVSPPTMIASTRDERPRDRHDRHVPSVCRPHAPVSWTHAPGQDGRDVRIGPAPVAPAGPCTMWYIGADRRRTPLGGTAMELRKTTTANADIARTWTALTDVTTWPNWTKSMTSVQRLDDGPLRVGSRARIKQPRMPVMIWQVDEIRDREEFTWSAPAPGLRVTGVHRLVANPDGTTRIELEIQQRGPLAGIIGWLDGGSQPSLSGARGGRPEGGQRGRRTGRARRRVTDPVKPAQPPSAPEAPRDALLRRCIERSPAPASATSACARSRRPWAPATGC